MKFNLACLATFLFIAASNGLSDGPDLPKTVPVESGLLEGVINSEGTVLAFKGIPYAAPPVGDLRWREPQTPISWKGLRKADQFGAPCMQPASPSGRQPPANMSEDCLFLNVWVPAKATEEKLAVLFFIHGGAGFFGSGNLNGEGLAKKGIIVVTLNYRLGFFAGMGHPDLTAESPHKTCGNYGLLDLIAGLKWVQNNITAFGGDPARVTIAGQSSGACLVHYLTTSPEAKGLFRGAIAMSFPYDYLTKPNTIPFIRQKEENGKEFARIKNALSLADLRKIPALDFVTGDPALAQGKLIHLPSGVARDGWAFPLAYPDALDQGLASDVPIMTGMTADDFGPPAPYTKTTVVSLKALVPKIPGEEPGAFLALCPPVTTDEEAKKMAKQLQIEGGLTSIFYWAKRKAKANKAPVYSYLFEQCVASERGASHGSDLAYWFHDLKDGERAWIAEDRRVADQVSSYWVNFVQTGNPNGGNLPEWPPFDADRPVTMSLSTRSGPRPIAGEARLPFYRDQFEK